MPLTLAKTTAGWWVLDATGEILDAPCGPYSSRAEAEDDRRGLERSEKYGDKPGYASADSARIRRKQKQELFE